MLINKIDAFVIFNEVANAFILILITKAIFSNVNRLAIWIFASYSFEHVVHASRINIPVPISRRHIRIFDVLANPLELKGTGPFFAGTIKRICAFTFVGSNKRRLIVIHAKVIILRGRLLQHIHIAWFDFKLGMVGLQQFIDQRHRFGRIFAFKRTIQQEPIHEGIFKCRSMLISWCIRVRIYRLQHMNQSDSSLIAFFLKQVDHARMG